VLGSTLRAAAGLTAPDFFHGEKREIKGQVPHRHRDRVDYYKHGGILPTSSEPIGPRRPAKAKAA